MKNKFYPKYEELIGYLFFGILTTLVNILAFYFLNNILSWSYLWANAVAIIISILFAYITNKLFVFQSNAKGKSLKENVQEFLRFISARLVSGGVDMLTIWILVDGIGLSSNFSKLVTQAIVVVLNYIFSKLFVFNK